MVTKKKQSVLVRNANQKQKKKLTKKQENFYSFTPEKPEAFTAENTSSTVVKNKKALSTYQQKLLEDLKGSRFRFLNEEFYTQTSHVMKKKLQQDRTAFLDYHCGYKLQEKRWKTNPTNLIIKWIQEKIPVNHIIVDHGCGEGRIAKTLSNRKIYSYDLVSTDPNVVTEVDIAQLPLSNNFADVSIFCLSLMGTNWPEFLAEGIRILKKKGILKIAEVQSRFSKVQEFIRYIEQIGFNVKRLENIDNYFYILEFEKKTIKEHRLIPSSLLSGCYYKKR